MGYPFIQEDVTVIYSTAPQTNINTMVEETVDDTKYKVALVDAFPGVVPNGEMVDDSSQVGDGSEFPRFVRLYRWGLSFNLSMLLNTELALVLIKRAFGGTVTNAVVTAGLVWDHTVPFQNARTQGRVPQATTFVIPMVGGQDFVCGDMFVQSVQITQQGDARPTATFALAGTGYHKRIRDYVTPLALPDPDTDTPEHHYFHGGMLGFTLNDGSVEDFAGQGWLDSYQFDMQNTLQFRRAPGDGFLVAGDVRSGSYSRSVIHGKRTAGVQFQKLLDDDLPEYEWLRNNTLITGLSITNVGDIIETTHKWELEIIVPASQLQSTSPSTNNNFLTVNNNLMALKDSVTLGLAKVRGRNGLATLT